MKLKLYDVEETRTIIIPRNDKRANLAVQKYIIDEDTNVIGLDCEWKTDHPSSNRKRADYHVALIQVATEDYVILFQDCTFQNKHQLPKLLSSILLNERIVKAGVGIEEDVRRILLQFQISVRGWLDLRCLAVSNDFFTRYLIQQLKKCESDWSSLSDADLKVKRSGFMPKLSLEKLVEHILNRSLQKSSDKEAKHLQIFGEWEELYLPRKLQIYAAADAAASLDVFLGLDEARHCNLRNSDYNLEWLKITSNMFTWRLVIEKSYIPKEIRLSCLDMIAENIDPRHKWLLTDYYGRRGHQVVHSNESCNCISVHKSPSANRQQQPKDDLPDVTSYSSVRESALLNLRQQSTGPRDAKQPGERRYAGQRREDESFVEAIKGFFRSLFNLIKNIFLFTFLAILVITVIGMCLDLKKK